MTIPLPGGDGAIGTLRLPARVHVGFGVRAQAPRLLASFGTRVLVLADPFLVGTALFDGILADLAGAGLEATIYTEIAPELPLASLEAAASVAADAGADSILALGGGSVLDAAKVVALAIAHPGALSRFYGENLVPGPVTPIVAMPTTAGTGSEVTPVAVVSDPERAMKVGISSPFLIPAAALVDPELGMGAPASVTAFSGIDALVHAVESFTAAAIPLEFGGELPLFTGRNALAEAMAREAAARLSTWLPVAVHSPGDREARLQTALGSLQAGIAFGPTGTHLSHALQYPIGALTHTPHGLGTGLLLPFVLDRLRQDPAASARIALLGSSLSTDDDAAAVVHAIAGLNARIGVPATLAEIGVTRDQHGDIAERALQSARLVTMSPVRADRALLLDILDRADTGALDA
ncbi:iron-containing alcohol dehydrogenase [Microbacterium sp. RD1]|uniref:iron-containing alcohol dehydrogenase n=1 Tax=Microbacterium sp. RD1 TaxID=3457313 RepID=UPI003FA56D6D